MGRNKEGDFSLEIIVRPSPFYVENIWQSESC